VPTHLTPLWEKNQWHQPNLQEGEFTLVQFFIRKHFDASMQAMYRFQTMVMDILRGFMLHGPRSPITFHLPSCCLAWDQDHFGRVGEPTDDGPRDEAEKKKIKSYMILLYDIIGV